MEYRECLNQVSPYVPGKSEEEIKDIYGLKEVYKLASNENPYGPTKMIKEANINLLYSLYPDNYVTNLRCMLSKKYGLDKDMFLFGNGSVEIIQMLSRIMLDTGDNIITELPSFSSYFSEAKIQDAQIKTIRFNEKYSFNLNEILNLIDSKTKMIYITNPNNPLGTITSKKEMLEFLKLVPSNILVVVDEAYGEFVRDTEFESAINLVKDYTNVCVLKTFSKAYGLAALRIGYIVANKSVITQLEKVRVPFNVSAISQKIAQIALTDEEHMKDTVKQVHSTIDYMYKELDRINVEYIKTQANFIMINTKMDSKKVVQELLKRGYIVRDGFPLIDTWIRVSIGTKEQMQGFISILCEVIL